MKSSTETMTLTDFVRARMSSSDEAILLQAVNAGLKARNGKPLTLRSIWAARNYVKKYAKGAGKKRAPQKRVATKKASEPLYFFPPLALAILLDELMSDAKKISMLRAFAEGAD